MSLLNPLEYDDLIIRHRQSSDILWSLKTWHHPLFDNKEQNNYGYDQAKVILQEMSHSVNIRTARFLAFIFAKIFNQVYENIYIDHHGIDLIYKMYSLTPVKTSPTLPSSSMTIPSTLFAILNTFSRSSSDNGARNLKMNTLSSPLTSKHYFTSPKIIYLPTHRSYMDFIILTYICFEYNIPLPCIAAAQDFLGLGLLANLLRHCGAFFIRRSFRSDLLYWTIFDEYVKTHLIHGDYPIEFFIEGTRSRTLKTLLPVRQGMLRSCLECYFRRQVDNLILIPIMINYEKVLEDNLHANELLGVPKPKESKGGLLKATQILKKSFGTMTVKFSEPIYVHDAYEIFKINEEKRTNRMYSDAFNRSIPRSIQPRSICQQDVFTDAEQRFSDELSYRIVNEQQSLTVIYPITIAAFSFLTTSIEISKNRSVSIEQLLINRKILFTDNTGVPEHFSTHYQISWPMENDENSLKQRLLTIYSDVFELSEKNCLTLKMTGDRLVDATLLMKLIMYRNTCLHLFAKPAYILLACQTNSQIPISYDQLKINYHFFIHLLAYEFVYDQFPTDDLNDKYFEEYLSYWIKLNYIIPLNNSTYKINTNFQSEISFITNPFEQYARAYLLIYQQENLSSETNLSLLIKIYQKTLLTKLDSSNLISILASSSNVISNALRTLNFSTKSKTFSDLRHMLTSLFQPISTHIRAKL
ncbi:hypothetical protein I4U23_010014 [Adineta vaga]|nr:hypothetical protein I4U23_010014 [Adineta vaga]